MINVGNSSRSDAGVTLIEVLLVSVITAILGLGILALQYIIGQNQVVALQNVLNVEEANNFITTMVREIRNTRPGDNAAYPLVTAQDQEFIFYSDIDYDTQSERVRYSVNGTNFEKGIIEPVGFPATYPVGTEKVRILSENVRNGTEAVFYYYNGDWPADTTNNPLPSPTRLSDTKLMRVYLKLNTKDDTRTDFILESYVQIRMLKDNL